MKIYLKSINVLSFSFCSLFLLSSVCYADAENPVLVKAKNNSSINITQAQLTPVIERYKKNNRKPNITKDEKIKLLKELVRFQLIHDQDVVQALRENSEIKKRVQQFEENLILETYLQEKIVDKLNITEDDLKGYYQKNKRQYALPSRVEASHILVRTRAEAESILGKLKKKENFDQLVAEYSIDLPLAIKQKGKMSLEPINKGEAIAELDQELFSHAEGEITDIVESQYGFHIIRIDKFIPVSSKPLKGVSKEIRKIVRKQKYEEAYNAMAAKLEKKAELEFFEDRIR